MPRRRKATPPTDFILCPFCDGWVRFGLYETRFDGQAVCRPCLHRLGREACGFTEPAPTPYNPTVPFDEKRAVARFERWAKKQGARVL